MVAILPGEVMLAPIEEKIRLTNETRRKYESKIDGLRKQRDAEEAQVKKYRKDLETVEKAAKKWEDEFKAAAQRQGRELSEADLQEYKKLRSDVKKRTNGDQMQIDKLKRDVDTNKDHVKQLEQTVQSHERAVEKLNADVSSTLFLPRISTSNTIECHCPSYKLPTAGKITGYRELRDDYHDDEKSRDLRKLSTLNVLH